MLNTPDLLFENRILFLTEDPELIRSQIKGTALSAWQGVRLRDQISTDEITPGWVCFNYGDILGEYVFIALKHGPVGQNDVKDWRFQVVVSGKSKGCGSSRENAPLAEKYAGIRLVLAESFEKIYLQNCQNIGLLTSTDFGLIERIQKGEKISLSEFLTGADSITADIIRMGGLMEYSKARLEGKVLPPTIRTAGRPMTLVEKIIAAHGVDDPRRPRNGVPAVKPGDSLFVRTDIRFSHEYVTAMADAQYRQAFGPDASLRDPERVFVFEDHLIHLEKVMPEKQRQMGLLEKVRTLVREQRAFSEKHGIKLYSAEGSRGAEAICHNATVEDIVMPGQVVIGTDSHTCTAGCLGAFAFGVGATDMAAAWYCGEVRVRVPSSVRYVLRGTKPEGVSAKDVILHILSSEYAKNGQTVGKVLEFTGEGLRELSMDERATLTNMSVEGGAFTGIIAADEVTFEYLSRLRGIPQSELLSLRLESDPDAEYDAVFEIDLSTVSSMVAAPSDPRNGVPVASLKDEIPVDIAYGGSCTGGKESDMDMYARVLREALLEKRKVPDGVKFYIQFGSQRVKEYAERMGYMDIFEKAGVILINPGCGACINAGPGVSSNPDQITISAINRNFPGRSGPGKVYLASPLTVAASAVAGKIVQYTAGTLVRP
ncbi:MAG: 3-isopropylmalate dehydratase [Armatimonadetes bacterium]|nr:3-isopropylmalate dehydratase [Armatimonadota bacterium]